MYILFAGDQYYPQGGMHDFVGSYATVKEAEAAVKEYTCDWWHVVDTGGYGPGIVSEGN